MATKSNKSPIQKIRDFLKKNYSETPYAGSIGSNSRVRYLGGGEYVVGTSSNGSHQNDIKGTYKYVMETLKNDINSDKAFKDYSKKKK